MKIGILKTDAVRPAWVPQYGEYPDQFIRLFSKEDPALGFAVYDVQLGEYPADIDEVDAYLITGSKSSVYEDSEWIARLMEFVRELHRRRKKLLGICFGHQLVAHALGGRTEKSSKGWGVGLQRYRFDRLPPWHDQGDPEFRILASHQDQVVEVAEGATTLASSAFCEHAVCQLGNHILTFQGHPEFVPGYSRELMDYRREQLGEAVYAAGMSSLSEFPEQSRVARWMLAFLRA